jgi:hypothetical protein
MRVNMVVVFCIICENKRMKPVEIVLRKGGGERSKMMEGVKSN